MSISKVCIDTLLNLRKTPHKPRHFTYITTYRCNSRCRMCGIWKGSEPQAFKRELKLEDIKKIFNNPFFSDISFISLGGGEPFLREDIDEIVEVITKSCPELNSITIPTNGLTPRTSMKVQRILEKIESGINLSIGVSIDGIGETHNYGRGKEDAFERGIKLIGELKELEHTYGNLKVGFGSMILPWNVDSLPDLVKLSSEMNLPKPQFWMPLILDSFFKNEEQEPELKFSDEQFRKAMGFLKGYDYRKDFYAFYAENMSRIRSGKTRIIPCFWGYHFLFIDPYGDVYPCSYACKEEYLLGNLLTDDPSDIWFSQKAENIRKTIGKSRACSLCQVNCKFFENITINILPYARYKLYNSRHQLRGKA
ncbi:MAG: radical SAM protein [Candidatus Methanoperedens sp.]|nr:radical SAM protein [Candidatus Methanoperedens sp.]